MSFFERFKVLIFVIFRYDPANIISSILMLVENFYIALTTQQHNKYHNGETSFIQQKI